jgi:hypothetical protein
LRNCFIRENTYNPLVEKIGVIFSTSSQLGQEDSASFWDVVKGWGQTWLWNNLQISGDNTWLAESITDNACMAVTDGSYIKEMYPHMNSAAFIFECSKGQGQLMGSFVEYTLPMTSTKALLGLCTFSQTALERLNKLNTYHRTGFL